MLRTTYRSLGLGLILWYDLQMNNYITSCTVWLYVRIFEVLGHVNTQFIGAHDE